MTQPLTPPTMETSHPESSGELDNRSRNQQILAVMADGKTPMLAGELEWLKEKYARFVEDQGDLTTDMAAAMSQSSETWHDNAPAEAIAAQSKTMAEQVAGLSRTLLAAKVMESPQENESKVTLGSLVFVKFGASQEVVPVFLTGAIRSVDDIRGLNVPSDSEVVTLQSPLGEALFDARDGQKVFYEVRGREMSVVVGDIVQLQPEG